MEQKVFVSLVFPDGRFVLSKGVGISLDGPGPGCDWSVASKVGSSHIKTFQDDDGNYLSASPQVCFYSNLDNKENIILFCKFCFIVLYTM